MTQPQMQVPTQAAKQDNSRHRATEDTVASRVDYKGCKATPVQTRKQLSLSPLQRLPRHQVIPAIEVTSQADLLRKNVHV